MEDKRKVTPVFTRAFEVDCRLSLEEEKKYYITAHHSWGYDSIYCNTRNKRKVARLFRDMGIQIEAAEWKYLSQKDDEDLLKLYQRISSPGNLTRTTSLGSRSEIMDKSEFAEKLSRLEFVVSNLLDEAELLALHEVAESLDQAHRYLSEAVDKTEE